RERRADVAAEQDQRCAARRIGGALRLETRGDLTDARALLLPAFVQHARIAVAIGHDAAQAVDLPSAVREHRGDWPPAAEGLEQAGDDQDRRPISSRLGRL